MADTTYTYTFSGDGLSDGSQSGTISGSFTIDYDTASVVSGSVSINTPNGPETIPITALNDRASISKYSVSGTSPDGTTLTLAYTGMTPSTFDSGSVQYFNPIDTYTLSPNAPVTSTNVTPCFVTGTLIRTASGDVAVENLAAGDVIVTAFGALRSIRWIGHRSLSGNDGTSLPMQLCPVRILAGAFGVGADGEERPSRDLRLSPGHTVLVNADENNAGGVLVPIMCLINGTSIARAATENVTYWHVELEGAHDILLAEGLPAESYLDWGDRAFFAEASDHALYNPDHVVPGLGARCRPVAIDGPLVETERRRLDALFAVQLAEQGQWDKADAFAWLA